MRQELERRLAEKDTRGATPTAHSANHVETNCNPTKYLPIPATYIPEYTINTFLTTSQTGYRSIARYCGTPPQGRERGQSIGDSYNPPQRLPRSFRLPLSASSSADKLRDDGHTYSDRTPASQPANTHNKQTPPLPPPLQLQSTLSPPHGKRGAPFERRD